MNEDEFDRMIAWCGPRLRSDPDRDHAARRHRRRPHRPVPAALAGARPPRAALEATDLPDRTGGPARYVRIEETGGRLGFITPLTHNFCESCNRVRVTCTGKMYMCLGQEDEADLCTPLRASEGDELLRRDPGRHRAQAQGP